MQVLEEFQPPARSSTNLPDWMSIQSSNHPGSAPYRCLASIPLQVSSLLPACTAKPALLKGFVMYFMAAGALMNHYRAFAACASRQ